MKNLSLFLLELVLIFIPACLSQNNDKQCFSLKLKPSYPCCEGDKVVYTDEDGDWGVEHNKWCGIGNGPSEESCFAVTFGYSCCKECKAVYTDEDGDWGIENNEWCGIKDSCASDVVIEEPVQEDPDFDFSFLKLENKKENILYSPLSIKYALRMLKEGALNNTYTEINKLVGNTDLTKYESIGKNLTFANGLFIKDEYYKYVTPYYLDILKDKYDAEIIMDEFKDAQNANKWIEDKTLGIIKDMLSDEIVNDEETAMLLINALAVDMQWVKEFGVYGTRGEKFYKDNDEEMIATMMHKSKVESGDVKYFKDDDITVLTMDLKEYEDTQLQFMAIMPNENLTAYIENVSKEQITEIDKMLMPSYFDGVVNIAIPKFKFSYDLALKDDLIKLGMNDSFSKFKADFTNIADLKPIKKNLFVKDALHKADIEFTEKGTKAAAATVIVMGGGMMATAPKRETDLIFNKPFMFIIRDEKTKDIWFTGAVYEPNLWEKDKAEYERN